MKLPLDIIETVNKEFGSQKDLIIEKIQNEFLVSNETERVLRCIIFLSEGDLALLSNLIESAKQDYRDVIFWAEYKNHESQCPLRVRDFNKPFGEEMIIRSGDYKERLPNDIKKYFNRKIKRLPNKKMHPIA